MAILGGMLIWFGWFGWFGFNGGSTLGWTEDVPAILLHTCLAAFWGGITATVLKYVVDGYIDVAHILNGVLGGAGCYCCRVSCCLRY